MTITKATEGLSITEAAEHIGVTPQTIRNWIAKGSLPAVRFGMMITRIDPADLNRIRQPTQPQQDQQ